MTILRFNNWGMLKQENKESLGELYFTATWTYDYLPPGYLEHFHTLSVSSPYYPVLLLYVKGSMIKIEPSTFYKEYHLGLEDNITSLPAKIAYFLNAFNQVKNPNVERSSIDSWKVTWIVRQNGHALLALPRTEKPEARIWTLYISASLSEKKPDADSSLMFLKGHETIHVKALLRFLKIINPTY